MKWRKNMNFISNNWEVIIAVVVSITGLVTAVYKLFLQVSNKQSNQVSQWMLWAVSEAESILGAGTGRLKFSFVYDSFVKAFPWVSRIMTVEMFSDLVNQSLDEMRKMIENNKAAADLILGELVD